MANVGLQAQTLQHLKNLKSTIMNHALLCFLEEWPKGLERVDFCDKSYVT